MKSLLGKLGLILIGLAIFGYGEARGRIGSIFRQGLAEIYIRVF